MTDQTQRPATFLDPFAGKCIHGTDGAQPHPDYPFMVARGCEPCEERMAIESKNR